jgi:hypothetical protein
MLWTLAVVVLVLWLLGAFGVPGRMEPWAGGNNAVHVLLVVIVILLLFQLL